MENLANLALTHIRLFMFYGEHDGIDPDFACKVMEEFPMFIAGLSETEKVALSEAAKRCLAQKDQYPDEYGYNPRLFTTEEEAFLEVLSTGDLYDDWK
jgi:hypothetical protein